MSHSTNESEDELLSKDQSDSQSIDEGSCGGSFGGGGAVLKKGPWTSAEDAILVDYVKKHGEGNWNAVQKHSGLYRCGKSCRLRWANHLRPNLKKGAFTTDEERLIVELHSKMGNKWARMAAHIVIDQVSTVDLKRTFLFTFLGFALVGPTLHLWYLYLSKLVTVPGAAGAFLRLMLDQFLFSPIFLGVFLSTLMTLEGKPSQVVPKLQQEWFSAVVANWQLWIPFQFLNFRFVPQQFQVLAANVVALAWNVILSFKAHKAILPK